MRRRRGFTMIEMLVVLGIIMLLAGILFMGLKGLLGSGKTAMTENLLQQCKSLLVEYQAKARNEGLPAGSVAAPANVADEENATGDRYTHDSVDVITNGVMGLLNSIPENRAALAKMPNERFLQKKSATITNPILLDGWRNPIIYVPPGGLSGVHIMVGTANEQTITLKSTDGRPFWASAGEDGDFAKGDDNMYSFEKK